MAVSRRRSPREGIMADKFKGTWYVSYEPPPGKRQHARMTETFPNEREAKKFARAKLVDTKNVKTDHRRNADARMARRTG